MYDDAAIARLLDRSDMAEEEEEADPDDALMKSFKVATFEEVEDTSAAEQGGMTGAGKSIHWGGLKCQLYCQCQPQCHCGCVSNAYLPITVAVVASINLLFNTVEHTKPHCIASRHVVHVQTTPPIKTPPVVPRLMSRFGGSYWGIATRSSRSSMERPWARASVSASRCSITMPLRRGRLGRDSCPDGCLTQIGGPP